MLQSMHSKCCNRSFGCWKLINKWLCSTVDWLFYVFLIWRLRHVQFFPKTMRPFAWKCLMLQQLFWDFQAHTRKSMVRHLSRCHRRISNHQDHILEQFLRVFWMSFYQRDIKRTQFFWHPNVHAILNVHWSILVLRLSNSIFDPMTILQYQFTYCINFFATTTDYGRPSRNLTWSELEPRMNSPYHS